MRIKTILFLFILAGGLNFSVAGQGVDVGLALGGGFPQGEFRENVESNGIGLDFTLAWRPVYSPVAFGLDLGFYNYGNADRKEIFNPNIPEVTIRVRTTNNILTGHFLLRLDPVQGMIQPYLDGLAGFNYLWTQSKVEDEDDMEEIASSTNFEDSAFSYGLGGGIKFQVAELLTEMGGISRWYIDFKVRYLLGGEAEYLKEGALRNSNGMLFYDTSNSRTDLFTASIGFVVGF